MQRVTRSTAVAVMPAPPAGAGAPGYFTGGNPGTGTPATVPGYEWLNGIQEELMSVIEAAGLAGSHSDHTLLLQAIQDLVASGTIPTGAWMSFPFDTPPPGWAVRNGLLVPRTGGWANLWATAQASGNIVSDAVWLAGRPGSFSTGDGSTTYRIPDGCGLFDRGFHAGSTAYDSNTGLSLGAYRDSQNKDHAHTTTFSIGVTSGGGYFGIANHGSVSSSYSIGTSSSGISEAYPRHSTSLPCIKL